MAIPRGDPWKRRDAWKFQNQFSRKARYSNLVPGFTWGLGAFVIYVAYDKFFAAADTHHGHTQEEAHH